MDGSTLSPYPHLSWFVHSLVVRSPRAFILHEYTAVAHRLILTEEGDADFVWTTGASDVACRVTAGDLGFFPGDSAVQTLGITTGGTYQGHELIVPNGHIGGVCAEEDVPRVAALHAAPVFRDAALRASALRLLAGRARGHLAEDPGAEIAARQVIIRLAAIAGAAPPDGLDDASVFPPSVMRQIVERVDAHLHTPLSLVEMGREFELSPSHFARKFQKSSGLSLNRFINRRRIGLALLLLKTAREPIAQLSLDLGFCSQSHFTRLFSGLTGLTPHQFRRAHRMMGD